MRIKDVNDMTANHCPCGSWLDHWLTTSKLPLPTVCPAKGCKEIPVAGAFVQKDNYFDSGWYIVPLCHKHNRLYGASLDLNDTVPLVPAATMKTCGQKPNNDYEHNDHPNNLASASGV